MPTPRYYGITDFSPAQNNEFDPRSLMPYTNESAQMEATDTENYDITEKGAIVTAPGFEEDISMGTGVPGKYIGNYEAAPDRRYLIGVSNDQVFYKRKWLHTPLHTADAFDSGVYGTFVASGDFGAASTNVNNEVRGSGCVSAAFADPGLGVLTGQSKQTVATLTSVDISDREVVEFFVNLSNTGINSDGGLGYGFTNVIIRVGSSASDYKQATFTKNGNDDSELQVGWNGFRFILADSVDTGTPDMTAPTFLEFEFNYSTKLAGCTILIDDVRAMITDATEEVVEVTTDNHWLLAYDSTAIINGVSFKGTQGYVHHILGHSVQSQLKLTSLAEGMVIAQSLHTFPTGTYQFATAVGFLLGAFGKTITHSDPEDETSSGGTIGFNGNITGLAPTVNKSVLVTLDTVNTEEVTFSFDDSTLIYTPVKGTYQAGIGGLSHKAIQNRYNDTIFLGTEGVAFFGEREELASGNYSISSLSWKVDKRIRQMNDDHAQSAASYYFRNKKEYGVALPLGARAITNNSLFIWKSQYRSWLYRSGFNIAHATEYRDSNDYEVYFADAGSDKIMKFADVYDYDGQPYVRRYKTKIFNMGVPLQTKRVPYIEVGGAMPKGSHFFVIVRVDGTDQTFKIDDTSLVVNSQSKGYIGDDFYGNEFYGGPEGRQNAYEFFRFYQRIPLPRSIIEGLEFQFEFYYEGTGRPHKIDLFGMKYTIQPEGKVPSRHINNNVANNVFIP